MFILIIDPLSGKDTQTQKKPEEIKDPDKLLRPMLHELVKNTNGVNDISPECSQNADRIKKILIRAMLRAAGQLFDRQADPDFKMLTQYIGQYTGWEATSEGIAAVRQFLDAIEINKPDVKSNQEKFLEALIKAWKNGQFEGLPEVSQGSLQEPTIEKNLDGG